MRTSLKFLLATVLSLVMFASPGFSSANQLPVKAVLLSDSDQVALGEEFRVGVNLDIQDGWHIYWTYPGNTGKPTRVKFVSDQDHTKVLQASFPYPKVFDASNPDELSFGYEHQVLIPAKAMVFDAPPDSKTTIGVHVSFLACKNSCVTGSADARLTLLVGDERRPSPAAPRFDSIQTQLPGNLSAKDAYLESLSYHDGKYELKIALPGVSSAKGFVPSWIKGSTCKIDQYRMVEPTGTKPFYLELVLHGDSCLPGAGGVLLAKKKGGAAKAQFHPVRVKAWSGKSTPEEKITTASSTSASSTQETQSTSSTQDSLWLMLLFAFLGGMLLNVMPCVIPVVIPKLLHVVRTAQKTSDPATRRKLLWSNSLAYSAGVLSTLLALATLVVVLKHVGHEVGWGFQFQNPWFLIFMVSLLLVLGLGMLHVFPLQSSSHSDDLKHLRKTRRRSPLLESFLTGLLVTFLGTPCTAPMLGPALGYAFTAGDLDVFVLLASVALGLSFPFLLLGAWTGWAKILPKKVTERYDRVMRGMAFLLFGTAVWLMSVLADGYGAVALSSTLWFCLVLAAGAWTYGLVASESEPWKKRLLKLAPIIVMVAVAGWWLLEIPTDAQQATQPALHSRVGIKWQSFDEETLRELRKSGKSVFVDFTAQWCMNCKANERLVIETKKTKSIIDKLKIVPLKADNTRRDPLIQKWLKRYHRAGVPMYLVFPACSGEHETILLPEILTSSTLHKALEKAGPSRDSCSP